MAGDNKHATKLKGER